MEQISGEFCVLLTSFLVVPVIGLYWSMRRGNFLFAWFGVIASALVIPWCLAWTLQTLSEQKDALFGLLTLIIAQLGIAGVCSVRLLSNLSARRFAIAS